MASPPTVNIRTHDTSLSVLIACVTLLTILFAGTPDLMDNLILALQQCRVLK